jgi:hypothetical protein
MGYRLRVNIIAPDECAGGSFSPGIELNIVVVTDGV